jgi:hypothetical protein
MMRSMTRWALSGCMALAALSAAAVLDVGCVTADAAPSVSRFAGTYVPADPSSTWTYLISDAGQITGSYQLGGYVIEGALSGRVRDDGSFSITQTETNVYEGRGGHSRTVTSRITYSGSMQFDGSGDLVVTANSGNLIGTFIWLPQ